jgi:lysyl-tRNA synthetase class 1
MVAWRLLERERKLRRNFEVLRTESGLGASGIPHIGSLGDSVRAYGVKLALQEMGCKSEFIAFSDDLDGLRSVPAGLPGWLEKYIGFPVSSIPDPSSCGHESYGDHMSSLLRDALDRCGIEYKFYSAARAYSQGLFNKQIEKILSSAQRVGQIICEELGQEKYTEILPYFPICQNCGRIYSTVAYRFIPEDSKVLYACKGGMEIKGRQVPGCGYEGEVDIRSGAGKLTWKGEFAARWDALKIAFEAYGKDIADSVRVNDRICREILGYEPPFHIRYEMFLDRSGRKISKSAGNVLTPQVWLRYSSPQSLLLLMFKRVIGTRVISIDEIPAYMNEVDELEDVYFGVKKVRDERELAKLRGLYEYIWLLKPPAAPTVHVPYGLLVQLTKIAPPHSRVEYITKKLREYGYLRNGVTADLLARLEYASRWVEDLGEAQEVRLSLSEKERNAIMQLIRAIRQEKDEKKLQNLVFEVAKANSLDPSEFFSILYTILLGVPKGPRLGPYIVAMGNEVVAEILERSVSQSHAT